MDAEGRLPRGGIEWHCVVVDPSIRSLRRSAKLTQAQFAGLVEVPVETFRTWDSGRRQPPIDVLTRIRSILRSPLRNPGRGVASAVADHIAVDTLFSLRQLSKLIGVSVYRLREAARDGRLIVTYLNRAAYGRPIPRATLLSAHNYKRVYFGKKLRWIPRLAKPERLAAVPSNYDGVLRALRSRLNLSQAALAKRIGAAGRAVVYQWESRKRKPTTFFWRKVLVLSAGSR